MDEAKFKKLGFFKIKTNQLDKEIKELKQKLAIAVEALETYSDDNEWGILNGAFDTEGDFFIGPKIAIQALKEIKNA